MARKLYCSITRDWAYCSEDRFSKLVAQFGGTEAGLADPLTGYVSREGKKLVELHKGDREAARVAAIKLFKNKIACTVTGEQMYISDDRMAHLKGKYQTNEDGVRARYVSRVAKRLREQLAKTLIGKPEAVYSVLTDEQKAGIDKQIQDMAAEGKLPAPSAPKGSKKVAKPADPMAAVATAAVTAAAEPVVETVATPAPETTVIDAVPAALTETAELDPLRHIDGESKSARKARIAKERLAAVKA